MQERKQPYGHGVEEMEEGSWSTVQKIRLQTCKLDGRQTRTRGRGKCVAPLLLWPGMEHVNGKDEDKAKRQTSQGDEPEERRDGEGGM